MRGKKIKRLRREFKEKFGRIPMGERVDIRGNIIDVDEFRKFKKEQKYDYDEE